MIGQPKTSLSWPSRIPRGLAIVALAWVSAVWLICIAVPLGAMIGRATGIGSAAAELLDPSLLGVVRITVYQAGLSALWSGAVGVPLGLWVGSRIAVGEQRWARWSQALLAIPYAIPTVVVGATAILWLGRSGLLAEWGIPLDWAYTLKGLILAHFFLNMPWVALLVAQARAQFPRNQIEAARTLGAGFIARQRHLIWPFVQGAAASALVQAFTLCVMSFGLVLLLGGGPPVQTLETAIFSQLRMGSVDLGGAAACALWQLTITLIPWIVLIRFQSRESKFAQAGVLASYGRVSQTFGKSRKWVGIGMLFVCAMPLLPYGALLFKTRWIYFSEPDVWASGLDSARVSLEIAFGTAIFSTMTALAGILAAFRFKKISSVLRVLLSLTAGVSVLVLGIGGWIAYGRIIDPFEGSLLAVISLQATIFFPLALRMLWPVAVRVQGGLLEAAWTLGASPVQAFLQIEWPRWRAPVLATAAITGGASLGEVAAVSLFYSEKLIPLPLWVARLMSQYRFDDAQAVSSVLLLVSVAIITVTMILGEGRR